MCMCVCVCVCVGGGVKVCLLQTQTRTFAYNLCCLALFRWYFNGRHLHFFIAVLSFIATHFIFMWNLNLPSFWFRSSHVSTTLQSVYELALIYCPKEESGCYTKFVLTVQFCQFLQTWGMLSLLLILQSSLLILELSQIPCVYGLDGAS